MATAHETSTMLEHIADFLATRPSPEKILAYKPSRAMQKRFSELVSKNRRVKLSEEEEEELAQFEQGELLMQLIKARLRPAGKRAS